MTDTIKYFDSTMTGAPSLSGTAGALIGLLDACLQDGFGSVTLDSLVVASNVATATYSTGHGFAMVGNAGPVILIAGATPAGLNGEWRVTVTSTTQFTFATSGISDQTASGTITAKRAPAGFTQVYSGTNKAAYRSDDVTGTRLYLQVIDSTTTYATISGYESMSDVDTGSDAFGSSTYWRKSNLENSATRPWSFFCDGRAFYFFPFWYGSNTSVTEGCFFGDFISYRAAGDPYGCAVIGSAVNNSPYPGGNSSGQNEFYNLSLSAAVAHKIARDHTQLIKNIGFSKTSAAVVGGAMGGWGGAAAYPDPMNNSLIVSAVSVCEATNLLRGKLPGLYAPSHYRTPANKTIIDDVGDSEKTLMTLMLGYGSYDYAVAAFDLTGPWR